uniref:cAMP-specific 3',5'-cyclic phosphodiesterase 4B n=1 Tax=Crocodylus porosus TaxID=8502 RepID=A0A7M4EWD0_CROPO
MKHSRHISVDSNTKDYLESGLSKSYSTSSHSLGIDLWRGRRCCSGNLQLPPLSQRQSERAKTPDRDIISRPTTLPLLTPPSIAITKHHQGRGAGVIRCPNSPFTGAVTGLAFPGGSYATRSPTRPPFPGRVQFYVLPRIRGHLHPIVPSLTT